ncbi:unnamed protein product [Lactuca saligna]|uniref:Uncharacterized protein n=1 Tax=Lactuca saligna TaxID=75948 RepID=A0AA35Z645_LACSI|nr:unnamed protein product [Lactuca saligna]
MQGIMEVVKKICPEVKHRLCARHILANFHKKFKGECYIKPFWRAIKVTTIHKFELAIEEIKSFDIGTYNYLIKRDPNCLSSVFLRWEWDVMQWKMVFLRASMLLLKKLEKAIDHYVRGHKDSGLHMLVDKTILRLCKVMKSIVLAWRKENMDVKVEEYVAEWITKSAFLRAYEYTIHPLNDSTLWLHMPNVDWILPPIRRRLPSRPYVKRKRDQAENELSGNTRHTISMACPSSPAPSDPTHVNQDPMTQDHVNQEHLIQENVHVNLDPENQDPVNEVSINQDPVNPVPVNQVPVNLSVRGPKILGVRARKPS